MFQFVPIYQMTNFVLICLTRESLLIIKYLTLYFQVRSQENSVKSNGYRYFMLEPSKNDPFGHDDTAMHLAICNMTVPSHWLTMLLGETEFVFLITG